MLTESITLDEVPMRAYCGSAVYGGNVRPSEEGVEEFRQAVLSELFIEVPEDGDPIKHTLLIAIPGGKA